MDFKTYLFWIIRTATAGELKNSPAGEYLYPKQVCFEILAAVKYNSTMQRVLGGKVRESFLYFLILTIIAVTVTYFLLKKINQGISEVESLQNTAYYQSFHSKQ